MSKRCVCLLLALFTLLAACGKKGVSGDHAAEISVFRLVRPEFRTGTELIRAEKIPYTDGTNIIRGAALLLKSIPENTDLMSAIPEGVDILSAELSGRAVSVRMSESYRDLSGMEKVVADSCLMLTMCSIPNVDCVYISIGGESGRTRLSPEDVLLENTLINTEQVGIRLYFPKEGEGLLASEYRFIDLREDVSAERAVLDELLKGPSSGLLRPALPEGTVVLPVYTQDGVCYVSFPEDFLSGLEDDPSAVRLAVYSVVNTLTCLSDVDSVMIIVQNNEDGLIGTVDISEPLTRKTSMIGSAVID